MKKTLRIITAILLVFSITVGMFVFTVFAEEQNDDTTEEMAIDEIYDVYEIQADADEQTNSSITWSFDENTKTLTISGEGDIDNYLWYEGVYSPWYSLRHEIKSIVIEYGILYLGAYCFWDCDKLESVSIPESVCGINLGAFCDCVSLESITIPDSVYWIWYKAFYGCNSLKSIKIGKRLNSVYDLAFGNNSLESIEVDPENESFNDGNGNNALIRGDELILGCKNTVIPDGIKKIGDHAFYGCSVLTNIVIPDSVSEIGTGAFGCCTGLTNVVIPGSVTLIGNSAFCRCTHMTSVVISEGVKKIDVAAFADCTVLTGVKIPDSVTSIGAYAFEKCEGLKNVIIGSGVESIGEYAFMYCYGLTNLVIKNGITSIKGCTFYYCMDLTNIFLPLSLVYMSSAFSYSNRDVKNVYYEGSEVDKSKIYYYDFPNDELMYLPTWHYNCSGTFWDISTTEDWFYSSAEYVYARGIMTGMGDTGGFAPYDPLHREQLAVMLYRLENSPATEHADIFPDVPDGTWFSLPIIWAYRNEIITGYQNGYFGAGDNITREQLAVMLYRYAANYKKLDVSKKSDLSGFIDASSVSPWALDAIKWAVGNGIITGKDNGTRIDPQGNAARCECAAMFERFMKKYGL